MAKMGWAQTRQTNGLATRSLISLMPRGVRARAPAQATEGRQERAEAGMPVAPAPAKHSARIRMNPASLAQAINVLQVAATPPV